MEDFDPELETMVEDTLFGGMIRTAKPLPPLGTPEEEIAKFGENVVGFHPVGSQVTCSPPPTENTDIDFLVEVMSESDFSKLAGKLGYKNCGSDVMKEDDEQPEEMSFQSFRRESLNLIVSESGVFCDRFLAASSVAKRLNLLQKADRIALFQAVLYGNACTNPD